MTKQAAGDTIVTVPFHDLVARVGDAVHTDDGPRLVASRCASCGAVAFPRRSVCMSCMSLDLHEVSLPGTGSLYSVTTVHVSSTFPTPYSVGYVDLPGGERVFSRIVGNVVDVPLDTTCELVLGADGSWFFSVENEGAV